MITKEQLDAVIKAVNEGGDDDDEITEDEVIAILRDTGHGNPILPGTVRLGAVSKSPTVNALTTPRPSGNRRLSSRA